MTVLSLTTNMNYKLPQSTITETHPSHSRSLSSLYGLRDNFLYLSSLSLSDHHLYTRVLQVFLSSHQETQKAKTLMDKVPSFLRSKWESTHGITMKTKSKGKKPQQQQQQEAQEEALKSQRAHTHLMIDWSSSVVLCKSLVRQSSRFQALAARQPAMAAQ
jgi:hypothetical protein